MGAKPDLLLHAGTHKTGTTALQAWLTDNRRLLAAAGILFPRAGQPGRRGQHNLHWDLAGHRNYQPRLSSWPELWQELASAPRTHTLLLSAEGFSHHLAHAAGAARLAQRVAPHVGRVTLHLTLRPQWSLVRAIFSQRTKKGRLGGLTAAIAAAIARPPTPLYLDYARLLRTIEENCPGWDLRLHAFQPVAGDPEALLREVFGQDLPLQRLARSWRYRSLQATNVTPGLVPLCRHWLGKLDALSGMRPNAALAEALAWLARHLPDAPLRLAPAEEAALAERFRAGNAVLRDRYGLDLGEPLPALADTATPPQLQTVEGFLRAPADYLLEARR